MKSRKKVHARKGATKRSQMVAYSRKKITFTECKPDVITIAEIKKSINI